MLSSLRSSTVYERTPGAATAPLPARQRRQPEQTTLWKIIAAELDSWIAHLAESTSGGLPAYILRELRNYLGCGLLERGFASVVCCECKSEILVAFSCHSRG